MRVFAVAICFLIGIGAANAQFVTGNTFTEQCNKRLPNVYYGVAMFVAGVMDKAATDERALGKYEQDTEGDPKNSTDARVGKVIANLAIALGAIKSYCIPQGATIGQAADVFCKYLKDNPADRHKNAADLVTTALNDAWGCKLSDIK